MALGMIFMGSIIGGIAAVISLMMGVDLLMALGLYSATGTAAALCIAFALYVVSRLRVPAQPARPRLLTFAGQSIQAH